MTRPFAQTYTDREIHAFDDGFTVAMSVARGALLQHIDKFEDGNAASVVLREVEREMAEWLEYQQSKD